MIILGIIIILVIIIIVIVVIVIFIIINVVVLKRQFLAKHRYGSTSMQHRRLGISAEKRFPVRQEASLQINKNISGVQVKEIYQKHVNFFSINGKRSTLYGLDWNFIVTIVVVVIVVLGTWASEQLRNEL